MVTKDDIADAMLHLGSYELEPYEEMQACLDGDLLRHRRKAVDHKLACRVVLKAFDAGLRRNLGRSGFRQYCRAQYRKQAGLSLEFWFLIGRMMIEIIPILWKWWQDRKGLQCTT